MVQVCDTDFGAVTAVTPLHWSHVRSWKPWILEKLDYCMESRGTGRCASCEAAWSALSGVTAAGSSMDVFIQNRD